ncbi:hypothetical protein BD626DRAFT_501128 [Schizophyllum amplum]|uniref:F-box domain-containing protein n=1 Tax=Schizophyllum amplum TaxID=97359 RepID=A0A550C9I8_9AGAR|nr:hypothetical protein BD626DRAFT_501128 [Auriculariopsis ampla]
MAPHFVADLVFEILDSDDHWWPRDLARLAVVSSEWLWPVRKLLYRRPVIRTFAECALLGRTLIANKELRELVRAIDLQPSGASVDRLEAVTLGGALAVEAERFLMMLAGHAPDVRELNVIGAPLCDAMCPSSIASLEWDTARAYALPKLERLRLSNLSLDIEFPYDTMESRLQELVLDNNAPNFKHLSVLTKEREHYDEQIRLVLESYELQSLQYDVDEEDRSEEDIFGADLPPHPSLRNLRLRGMKVCPEMLSSIAESCPNLEQLFVQGRSCLGLPWCTYPPFRHWTKTCSGCVESASAQRDIHLH